MKGERKADAPAKTGNAVTGAMLIYDGDCPFCSNYAGFLRLKDTLGELYLINARDGGEEVNLVRRKGLKLDEGMVLKLDGQYYHGEECLHRLALLSSPVNAVNRLNRLLFSSKAVSRVAYPVLRFGRNSVLRLLGRSKLGY